MPGLLCILAHPDDETFCSGLLAKLAARHVPVHLLYLTRGEGGTLGYPQRATRESLRRVREEEAGRAARALRAAGLEFLSYVDPVAGEGGLHEPAHDPTRLQQEIIEAIARHRPEVVLTHGSNGDYGHPAHRLVHRAVKAAVMALGSAAPLLYSFNAYYPRAERPALVNPDDPAHLVFDAVPFLEARVAALAAHASQVDVFVGRRESSEAYLAAIKGYFRALPREGYRRQWPPVRGRYQDVLTAWLGLPAGRGPAARALTALHGKAWMWRRRVSRRLRRRSRPLRARVSSALPDEYDIAAPT